MASQVSGSLGSANNGAIVSAILLTNGRPNGVATSDVVASGNFTLKGLAAGLSDQGRVEQQPERGSRWV